VRPTQIIQAAAALIAAVTITFLQPQREHLGVLVIGTIGVLIISIGFALSHLVMAVLQRKLRAYIANGLIVAVFAYFITATMIQIPMMQEHLTTGDHPAGADNSFDLLAFGTLSVLFLSFNAIANLAVALTHRQFKQIYRDNLISAGLFGFFALAELFLARDGVSAVGFLNAACIFTAVHLGIAAASPKTEKAKA
jgi:hypothetical protein